MFVNYIYFCIENTKAESLPLAEFYSGHNQTFRPLQWWIIAPAFSH